MSLPCAMHEGSTPAHPPGDRVPVRRSRRPAGLQDDSGLDALPPSSVACRIKFLACELINAFAGPAYTGFQPGRQRAAPATQTRRRSGATSRRRMVNESDLSFKRALAHGALDGAFDTIVIGSGAGGLSTAALLGLDGQRVLLLERGTRDRPLRGTGERSQSFGQGLLRRARLAADPVGGSLRASPSRVCALRAAHRART